MSRVRISVASLSLISLLALGACTNAQCKDGMCKDGQSKDAAAMKMTDKPLYDRLGGEPAIKAVVDDFVGRAAGDPKVNFTRKGTGAEWQATPENVAHLKSKLVEFIAMASGGPVKYTGRDMKRAHAGMGITSAEFDALAADLKASLDKFNVPAKEQGELLGAVAGAKKDIVER
jgi:hemoglobin